MNANRPTALPLSSARCRIQRTCCPRLVLWLSASIIAGFTQHTIADTQRNTAIAEAIRLAVAERGASALRSLPPALASNLRDMYAAGSYAPLWLISPDDQARAREVIDALRLAASHGLDPSDYAPDLLQARIDALRVDRHDEVAALDVALSATLNQLAHDVGRGLVDPQHVHPSLALHRAPFDATPQILQASRLRTPQMVLSTAAPAFPAYERLREALVHYRRLAADEPATLPPVRLLRDGMRYGGLHELHRRLVLNGDLDEDAPLPSRYEGALVEAVIRFQARHGLEQDGLIGPATLGALDAPFAARVRQIELALERLRWWPTIAAERFLVVNIPEFRLWGFDRANGAARLRFRLKVIAGRASETRTPLFATTVRGVEFHPYWNVPDSITRKELLPILSRDRRFLEREDMEIVTRSAPPGIVAKVDRDILAQLGRGELRLRQRPGPLNALGRMKLTMPNRLDIYLHDTPSTELFRAARRDFSHGCVRVDEPERLVEFLLESNGDWDAERVRTAFDLGTRTLVALREPVPVVLTYSTVVSDPDGRLLFLADIYRLDLALERALGEVRARRAASRLSSPAVANESWARAAVRCVDCNQTTEMSAR